ncbi:MAG: prepilin-type N-terminal cleavage/methylation domain-containing protein [Polyangiaceae bacterium]
MIPAARPVLPRLRARRRRARGGFTLVELLVSLVAGLLVSLAVVALSREATYSFHEEMRSATAEMSVRTALDRLKADVQRAGYMATGNVLTDVHIPLDQRDGNHVPAGAPANLANLAGINYHAKGSKTQTPLSSAGDNALEPDSIDLTGNFTSTDAYVVSRLAGGKGCAGPRLYFSMDSAATYRVMTSSDPDATLRDMFQPVKGESFLVRIADDLGRHEFVYGCKAQTAGWSKAEGAWVELAASASYLEQAYGFVDGRITVNPVQTIRWEIRPLASSDTTYAAIATDPASGDGGVSKKYNLVRSWLSQDNTPIGPAEVVAEYAVDLKFAFTVDLGDYAGTAAAPDFRSFAFGADDNKTYVAGVTGTARPERVRAVRVRFSSRAAVPDRNEDQRLEKNNYTIRYCLDESGCSSGSRSWARVRTATTEVALPNQARNFY